MTSPTPNPSSGSPERASTAERRSVRFMAAGLLALVALGTWLAVRHLLDGSAFSEQLAAQQARAPGDFGTTLFRETLLNPWFYGVLALVILLERMVPARPEQPVVSRGFLQDLLWLPFTLLAHVFVLPAHILFLRFLYERHLDFLTVDAVAEWPAWARVLLTLLVSDFLFWASHYVRHKVTVLWYFHAVHHSQKDLNFFTEYRVHPLDDVFLYTVGFIPFFMMEHSFLTIVAITWVRHWHTRLYHSNVRSNFGWLRYVLVTPQSHRVHHSIEPPHYDKNFGLTFSIWDHLFGTQYRGYDEYPATGIDDHEFPFEQKDGRFGALGRLVAQLVYPFAAIARRVA